MIWKALLLEDGAGIEPDPERATDLLHRAATSGDSQYATLGKLHYASNLYLGRGIEKDEAAARQWFEAAAAEGSEEAATFLRTGYHTGARDQSGLGVGAPPDAVAGPSLSAVASDPEPLPGWALGAMLALIGLGAAFQAMRRPTRERAA